MYLQTFAQLKFHGHPTTPSRRVLRQTSSPLFRHYFCILIRSCLLFVSDFNTLTHSSESQLHPTSLWSLFPIDSGCKLTYQYFFCRHFLFNLTTKSLIPSVLVVLFTPLVFPVWVDTPVHFIRTFISSTKTTGNGPILSLLIRIGLGTKTKKRNEESRRQNFQNS